MTSDSAASCGNRDAPAIKRHTDALYAYQQRATIESLMGDEFQVMGDEAEPALSRTEKVKQAAMETLQRWRTKAEEGEK